MIDLQNLVANLYYGIQVNDFESLDPELEKEELKEINERLASLKKSLGTREELKTMLEVARNFEYLKGIANILDHPIHMNVFSDKYGNKFIQARTSLRDKGGKMVLINAYVGSVKKFEKGENDPRAISKGKALVRKKMKKYFLS